MNESVGISVNVTTPGMREAMTAAKQLGDEARRAGATVAGAETAGAGGAPGAASLRGLYRELATAERLFGALNVSIEKLVRTMNPSGAPGGGGAGPGTQPLAVPGMPGAPGAPSGGGGGWGGGGYSPPGTYMARQLLASALGVAGIGVGVGAVTGEVRRMGGESRQYEEAVFRAALAGGGEARDYAAIREAGLQGGDFIKPDVKVRMLERARRFGVPMRDPGALGVLGQEAFGSPEQGGQFATQSFLTLRNDKALEILGDIRGLQKQSGRDIGEQVQLSAGLLGIMKQTSGQVRRSDEDVVRMRGAQRLLEGLPGDVGQGEGGLSIASRIMGRPANDWLTIQAYMMQGGDLSSDKGRLGFLKFSQDWSKRVPGVMAAAGAVESDPTRRALLLAYKEGLTGEQAEGVAQGKTTMADIARERQAAQRGMAAAVPTGPPTTGLEETVGGKGMETTADLERMYREHPLLARGLILAEQVHAQYPKSLLAAGVGATALVGRGAWPFMRAILGRGGAQAGMSGAGMASGIMKGLGPAAAGAGDVYEAATGEGWKRFLPAAGGMVGAGVGAMFGGVGAGPGFIGGSIAGGLLEQLVGGGSTRARMTAAAENVSRETGPGGGWAREEVAEHLVLLRALVQKAAGMVVTDAQAAIPPIEGGAPDEMISKTAQGMSAHRTAGRIDPKDPMFDAEARRAGIDPAFLRAIISRESSFDPNAVSETGAAGIGQFTKGTWRSIRPGKSLDERYNPKEAVGASADLLRQELDFFGGDRSKASMAYFHGRGGAQHPGAEERAYAAGVEKEYRVMVDLSPEAREMFVAHPHEDQHDMMVSHRRRG